MGKIESIMPADRLPIFIAAGVLKDKKPLLDIAREEALAMTIAGSYVGPKWPGNDANGRYNVFWWDEEEQAAYNSIGLKGPGMVEAGAYLPEVFKAQEAAGQIPALSISTLKGEDPAKTLPDMVEWGLDKGAVVIEVNGSCPNQDPEHPMMCDDIEETGRSGEAIRDRIGHEPIVIYKVSRLPRDIITGHVTRGIHHYFDGVDTINTLGNQPSPINPATGRPAIEVNQGLAGQSGPIINDLARENLVMWKEATKGLNFDILSTGGIKGSAEGGKEIYDRVHRLGALMVGLAQAPYRANNPRDAIQNVAFGYAEI
jgi:dihydroorotate dehydrogenase